MSELSDFVRKFLIWVELSIHRVLGIPNNHSQNEVANQKFFALDLLVIYFGKLFLITCHSLCSFFGEGEVLS